MKFVCDRKTMAEALQTVGYVASQKAIKPVLQDVRITALDDVIELSATDLEVAMKYRIKPTMVEEKGTALVPASKMVRIFKEVDEESVSVQTQDEVCVISFANSRFRLSGEDPEQFPEIPCFDEKRAFFLDTRTFRELIDKTGFAASKDDIRYAMNGVLFECEGGKLSMIATDGRRLALCSFEKDFPEDRSFSVIVPKKGMEHFERAMGPEEEKVAILIDENQIMIKTTNAEVSTRLIEGDFPDYKNVIPESFEKVLTLNTFDIMSAIKQCAIVTDPESRVIKMVFREKELVLVAHPPDGDEAVIRRVIDYNFDELAISFNPDFLLEGLRAIEKEEKFEFLLIEKLKPGILSNGKDYRYLIMPLNIEERIEVSEDEGAP